VGYFQDWAVAKKSFETKTGGAKKPSEKFWGVYRKSSGLEKACKGLDDALKKRVVAEMQSAEATYRQTSKSYSTLLMQTSTTDKDGDYKTELRKLEQALYDIADDFVKERDQVQQSLFKLAKADLDKYERGVSKTFELIIALLEKAEAQYQVCDSHLRDLSMAAVERDQGSVKKSAVSLNSAVKDLDTLVKHMNKIYSDCDKKVDADLKVWEKANKDLVALFQNQITFLKTAIEKLPMNMTIKCDQAKDLMDDAKRLLQTAGNALRGQVDTDKVFTASIGKFAQRAANLATNCNNDVIGLEGDFDMANFQYMNTPEDMGQGERSKRFDAIRSNLNGQMKQVPVFQARLEKAKTALRKEFDRYPAEFLHSPKVKTEVGYIEEALKMLDEGLEKLDAALAKIKKLLVKAVV
jgi:hypothetical protein